MIKYNESLQKYDYILSFDLAKHTTGWALVDIKNSQVIMMLLFPTIPKNRYGMIYINDLLQSSNEFSNIVAITTNRFLW